jgi:hypothetical protein
MAGPERARSSGKRDGGASPSSPARSAPGRSAEDWGRRGLTAAGRRIALAAAEALLSDRDEHGRLVAPAPAACQRVADEFGLAIGACSANLRRGVGALLGLVELLPPLVVRRPARMSRLPLPERVGYLQALEDSRLGVLAMLLVGVKIPMAISAFEEGDALRMTGFDRATTTATQPAPQAEQHGGGGPAAAAVAEEQLPRGRGHGGRSTGATEEGT